MMRRVVITDQICCSATNAFFAFSLDEHVLDYGGLRWGAVSRKSAAVCAHELTRNSQLMKIATDCDLAGSKALAQFTDGNFSILPNQFQDKWLAFFFKYPGIIRIHIVKNDQECKKQLSFAFA